MMYAFLENGAIVKTVGRPRWFNTNGDPVSDAILAESGYLPLVDSKPSYDPKTQDVSKNQKSAWTIQSDKVVVTYTVRTQTVQEVYTRRINEANRLRDQGIFGGAVDWTRPGDSVVIPVDMRGPGDRANIQDLRSAAIVMDGQGVTDAVMQFRAADNIVYNLTPQDMIAMSTAMMQRGQQWYAAAWAHKDALKAIADDPAKTVADLVAYDLTVGWP